MHRYGHNALEEYLPDECFLGQGHLDISLSVFRDFARTLSKATNERPIQTFIADNPELLACHLTGHLGRWVAPQQRLGAEHVVDFMIADQSSMGLHWVAVELESTRETFYQSRRSNGLFISRNPSTARLAWLGCQEPIIRPPKGLARRAWPFWRSVASSGHYPHRSPRRST